MPTKCKPLPSKETLVSLLRYDALTGKLFWKPRPPSMFKDGGHTAAHSSAKWNSQFADKEAFTAITARGYKHGRIWGNTYYAHRIIFKIENGVDPIEVDHQSGKKHLNMGSELRSVSHSENMKNRSLSAANKSGVMGVHWDKRTSKWHAQIRSGDTKCHLGYFASLADAAEARKRAEIRFGFHRNHGRLEAGLGA